jgi:dienelactone hydrolase
MYRGALESGSGVCDIPVERIRCPVLLVSGGADQLWPSAAMAERVATRIGSHGGDVEHLCYRDAGHSITLPALDTPRPWLARFADMGGTAATNRDAANDAWPKIASFLSRSAPQAPATEAD